MCPEITPPVHRAAVTVNALNNTVSFGSVNVGSTSPTQQFKVTFLAATTVGAIGDLTLGATNQDYVDGGSSSCTAKSYAANATCVISLAYKPSVPGTKLGSVVFYNGSNVPVFTLPATGVGTGSLLSFGFAAPTNTRSAFNGPSSVSIDGTGNMYVSDTLNNRVVRIPTSGASTNVGTGLLYPDGLAVDGSGNLYVSDANGIKKIPFENGTLNSAHQTTLSIAGGVQLPAEIAFDSAGNMYIADSMNNRILKLTQVNGALNLASPTVIGSGFNWPEGVAVDAAGNVYVADTGFPADPTNGVYGRIVKIAAGTGAQSNLSIPVSGPSSIAIDASGELFISDTNNTRVLQVSPTLVNQTPLNLSINATNAQYFGGLAVDLNGSLWAPDFLNNQIVHVAPSAPNLNLGIVWFAPGTAGPQTTPVNNIGNANLTIFGFQQGPTQYFFQQGGTCLAGTSLSPGAGCTLSIEFNVPGPLNFQINTQFNVQDNVNNQTAASPHLDTVLVTGISIL